MQHYTMNLKLKVWRQKNSKVEGRFESYDVNNISSTDKWEKDTTDVFLKLVKVLESKSDSYTLLFTKFNSIYLTSNKACSAKELEKPEVTMKTVKTIFTQILSLKNVICLNKVK